MPSDTFNRPPRFQLPELPDETVDIPAPPRATPYPDQNWLMAVIPVTGIALMALFYLLRGTEGGGSLFSALPLFLLAGFTIGGTLMAGRWRRQQHDRTRDDGLLNYIRLLESKRARLQAAYDAQMGLLGATFPEAEAVLDIALSRQPPFWERRPGDADFAAFRLGLGVVPSRVNINAPNPDIDSDELGRALALVDTYRSLYNAPVVINLGSHASVGLSGAREQVLRAARAAICHLAVTHSPQDVHLHLIAPRAAYDEWAWMEWLPHTSAGGAGGAADLLAFDPEPIHNLLGNLSQIIDERAANTSISRVPHLLLIVDGSALAEGEAVYERLLREGAKFGASVLCLSASLEQLPGDCQAVADIRGDGHFRYGARGAAEIIGTSIDQLSMPDAEHVARAVSVTAREAGAAGRIPRRVDFLDIYGVNTVEELRGQISPRWRRPIFKGILPHPVAIGRESPTATTEILLDEDHHGPHGVLAGTTGSGKSELLQTLVCALALEHDPRLVNFLLIDFKGGSSFNVFAGLPHRVGTVTNLDGMQIERALEALKAETRARQQFLKTMNVRDITQYHRYFARTDAHVQDPSYQPMPHLFIIVDEFAQLAKELPDFLSELVRTAQVGRSLGLHLILGTQSPMDVITDEMNANLQFRICLRVQNIEASRAMLRRPDAAYLPAGWPGRGYLQVGERGLFKQFQTAYVGGDYQHSDEPGLLLEWVTERGEVVNLLDTSANGSNLKTVVSGWENPLGDEPYTTARALTDALIEAASLENIPPLPPLLLPPLDDHMALGTVFKRAGITLTPHIGYASPFGTTYGARTTTSAGETRLIRLGSAPVGLIDDIYTRSQEPLWVHLNAENGGHLLLLGAPGSGKSTFIRTLALSLALLHSPERLHLYFLASGAALDDLGDLPHAESVVHGGEAERVRRLFRRLLNVLDERQSGRAEIFEPAIVLFVDPFEPFRDAYYEQHMADFERLVSEGRSVGIFVVIAASSPAAVPERLRSLIPQRVALQLGGASDYTALVGAVGSQIGRLPRGRGFIPHNPPLVIQTALPTMNEPTTDADVADVLHNLIADLRRNYLAGQGLAEASATIDQSQSPLPLRELPARIPFDSLPYSHQANSGSPSHTSKLETGNRKLVTTLGRLDDDSLNLYVLDWVDGGPHFVVSGSVASGKTNLLHLAGLAAAQQHSPENLRLLLIDLNGRSLRALNPLKHMLAHITDLPVLAEQIAHLEAELAGFYARWQVDHQTIFPRTVLLIDDYDAFSESADPALLRRLRDLLRLPAELGLHIWAAGYLERATDPLIRQLLLRRSGFGLGGRDSLGAFNLRTASLSADLLPPGRAYRVDHHSLRVLQTGLVENAPLMVNRINAQIWPLATRAAWIVATPFLASDAAQPSALDNALTIDTAGLLADLLGEDDEQSN